MHTHPGGMVLHAVIVSTPAPMLLQTCMTFRFDRHVLHAALTLLPPPHHLLDCMPFRFDQHFLHVLLSIARCACCPSINGVPALSPLCLPF